MLIIPADLRFGKLLGSLFILSDFDCRKSYQEDLKASITFTAYSLKFTCTLKQTDNDYNRLARDWESRVRDEVMKQLTENIDCVEKTVPSDVWDSFIDWTGTCRISLKSSDTQNLCSSHC